MRGVNHFGASGLLVEWDRKEAEQPHRCGSRPTHGLTAGRLSPIMGSGGSADLTFDHAGERAVADGGAVVGQMALPALVQWSLPVNFGSEVRAHAGLDEALHGLRRRQRVEPLVAGGA